MIRTLAVAAVLAVALAVRAVLAPQPPLNGAVIVPVMIGAVVIIIAARAERAGTR